MFLSLKINKDTGGALKISYLCNTAIRLAIVAFSWTAGGFEAAQADDPASTAVYVGAGLQEDAYAGYVGGVLALNGDLEATGTLARWNALYVDYDFDSESPVIGTANGRIARGNVSLGYQFSGDGFALSAFGGIDYQDRNISPSAAETGDLDDHTGFIVTTRLATLGPTRYPASIEGNYSTANDEYYVQARVARDFGAIDVGPEIAALGNEDYNAVRGGVYASYDLENGPIVQFSVGYHDSNEASSSSGSEDSAYGNIVLVYVF